MSSDELLIAARASAKKQLASTDTDEDRLVKAFLEGAIHGAGVVSSTVEANLIVKQAKG